MRAVKVTIYAILLRTSMNDTMTTTTTTMTMITPKRKSEIEFDATEQAYHRFRLMYDCDGKEDDDDGK